MNKRSMLRQRKKSFYQQVKSTIASRTSRYLHLLTRCFPNPSGKFLSVRADSFANARQLLELSGIGDAKRLSGLNIPCLIDLPQVGENYQVCTFPCVHPYELLTCFRTTWDSSTLSKSHHMTQVIPFPPCSFAVVLILICRSPVRSR
jgi:hypothetical protein